MGERRSLASHYTLTTKFNSRFEPFGNSIWDVKIWFERCDLICYLIWKFCDSIAFHFLSCTVLFCCTVHYCLFSFLIFSLLTTSSINWIWSWIWKIVKSREMAWENERAGLTAGTVEALLLHMHFYMQYNYCSNWLWSRID